MVRLTSVPTGPYSVEVLVPARGTGLQHALYAHECAGGSSCPHQFYFSQLFVSHPEVFRSHVWVRVTTIAGSLVTEVPNVNYVKTYPNGRRCPPPCPYATVTAEVLV